MNVICYFFIVLFYLIIVKDNTHPQNHISLIGERVSFSKNVQIHLRVSPFCVSCGSSAIGLHIQHYCISRMHTNGSTVF